MSPTPPNGVTSLRLSIPADLSRVAEVRAWLGDVGASGSLSESRIFDLQVAASEATANGIEHAASEVELVAWILPDRLIVEITNDGVFQPGLYKDHGGRRRGLGLPLMVSLADHVSVSRMVGGKTRVSLTFFGVQRDPDVGLLGSALSDGAKQSEQAWSFWRPASLIWLPIPLLIAAVFVFIVLGLRAVHEESSVFTTFNVLFIVAPMLIVSYLAARSYGRSRMQALVFLGAGSLLVGLAYLIGGPLITDPNHAITVADIAICAGSLLFLWSAIQTVFERRGRRTISRVPAIGATYAAVVVFMGVVIALTLAGLIPAFFIPGQGFTAWRNASFGLAAAGLIAASFIFALTYRRLKSPFLLWWLSGLGLMGAAFAIAVISQAPTASPVSWLVRSGQWLAGLYLLGGIFSLQHGEASSILPLERALEESEDRYKNLVDVSPDALLVDVDGTHVFANAAAARLYGARSPSELIGENALDRVHLEDRELFRQQMEEVIAGAVSPPREMRLLRLDGIPVAVEASGSRVEFGGRLASQVVYRDITERKQAEEALSESEERLRLALEAAEYGTWDLDLVTGQAVRSLRHDQIFGYEELQPEWTMEVALRHVSPEDHEKVIEAHTPAEGKTEMYVEGRMRRVDGSTGWFMSTGRFHHDDQGRPVRIVGVCADITERKRAEEALRLTHASIDVAPEMVAWFTPDGRVRYANDATCRTLGYSRDELMNMTALDFTPGMIWAQYAEHWEEVRKRRSFTLEVTHRRKDGTEYQAEVLVNHVVYEGQEYLFAYGRDITERKKADEVLKENLAVLEKSQEIAHLGSWTVDWDTGLFQASDEDYRIYGLEPGTPTFMDDVWGMIHPDDLDSYRDYVESVRLEGRLGAVDYRIVRPDGSVRHLQAITDRVVRDAQGKIRSAFGITLNVTERKQAEERLRTLAEENERLYRQQLDIAENLQGALLHIPSEVGPVRLGHLYRSATEAARVGGDFYDVFQVKEGKIALLIGDVAGHGIEAARAATLVKDVVHAFIHQTLRTHEVLKRTNTLLIEKQLPGYVTLFLGILDPQTGELRYSSAGHPDMLLRRASAEIEHLGAGSAPLGIYADAAWKPSAVELQADDLLVLFTDGVIEARRKGELFGEKRLESLVKRKRIPAERLPDVILDRVLAFSEGMLQDDLAILTLQLKSQSRGRRTEEETLDPGEAPGLMISAPRGDGVISPRPGQAAHPPT